ncbi:MAG: fimbria/pilus periplasmic chaperone [Pseudomonadota bacterium]|nr:fimbria/pilus periplasmic chaperone [Pseudomonadota bacterium]
MFKTRSRLRAWGIGIAGAAILAATTPAVALLVQPIVIRMQTSGKQASAAITVVNDRNRPNTVELKLSKLVVPKDGPVQLTPDNGDNFLIFPPIATIQPGKTQVFRVRWVGEPVLGEAQSYMITTGEVPIEQKGTGVQVVYAIQSLLTVSSPKMASVVSVVSAERASHTFPASETGAAHTDPGMNVTFANTGNDVAYISDYAMRMEIPGTPWKLDVNSRNIQQYVGLGLIPPNAQRTLFVPVTDLPATGEVKFSFKHDNLG